MSDTTPQQTAPQDTPEQTSSEAPEQDAQETTEPTDWKALSRKWEARAKENKAAVDELGTLKPQLEKLQAERDEFAAKVTAFETQQERQKTAAEVAEAAGVPVEALRGETREDLEAHAKVVKDLLNINRPGPVVGAQGKQGRVNVTDPKREAARQLFGTNK